MSNIDKQDSQVQRYANFGVDMMELADGGYVKYSDYVALLGEMEAAQAKSDGLANTLRIVNASNAEMEEELEAAESGFPPLTVERLMREKDALEKRVVELETRMVKLPERYEVDMCPTPSPDGERYSREDILAALVSAGVSYAAAGKGE